MWSSRTQLARTASTTWRTATRTTRRSTTKSVSTTTGTPTTSCGCRCRATSSSSTTATRWSGSPCPTKSASTQVGRHEWGMFLMRPGLEPVPRCEPSTHQAVGRWLSYCTIESGVFLSIVFLSLSFLFTFSFFSFFHLFHFCSLIIYVEPVVHDWCNKRRGMCYPVSGMMHIKEPLLLIRKSSPCSGSGFPLSRYLRGPLP